MNPYLKNLSRIEFVITMACTGKCKHCSQGDHNSNDNIDKSLGAEAVLKIAEKYNIDSVMTFGGEPLLHPETVCKIHRAATQMNITKRQLITNGYFSKDLDRIKDTAEMLAESGVNEILLSVDVFHQETIPIEYVRVFALAAKETHTNILLQPAWLVSPDNNNPYNRKTKEILSEFTKLDFEVNEGNIIFPSGNALKYLSEYFDLTKEQKSPYWEDPSDIRAICFSSNGDILGSNIYEQDIMEILSNYRP